jgi:hypothetical protein
MTKANTYLRSAVQSAGVSLAMCVLVVFTGAFKTCFKARFWPQFLGRWCGGQATHNSCMNRTVRSSAPVIFRPFWGKKPRVICQKIRYVKSKTWVLCHVSLLDLPMIKIWRLSSYLFRSYYSNFCVFGFAKPRIRLDQNLVCEWYICTKFQVNSSSSYKMFENHSADRYFAQQDFPSYTENRIELPLFIPEKSWYIGEYTFFGRTVHVQVRYQKKSVQEGKANVWLWSNFPANGNIRWIKQNE